MGANHFSKAPNISIPRSKFKMPKNHTTSFQFGKLVPIDCFEVIAGDTFNLNLTSFIRMSTPIAPIMSNIRGYVHAFFIPFRLLWKHTEEFYGANKTSAGYQRTEYLIPHASVFGSGVGVGSVANYLGKPLASSDISKEFDYGQVSVLKERAYWLVWSEWYRAQQLQTPFVLNDGDAGVIGNIGSTQITLNSDCANVCKQFDYFTAATLAPQYGASVTLPLGTFAPLYAATGEDAISEGAGSIYNLDSGSNGTEFRFSSGSADYDVGIDLSQATAATINSIRYAFAVQKYLERSNFGSRFFEMLNLHYGVTSPDARLQRPEYLGGTEFMINVQQVLSTADAAAGANTKLGQPGAVSVTVDKKNLFNKGFVEPGYIMVLLETKHDHYYAAGLQREDTRFNRFEFYSPEFANLGDQAIKNKEIYLNGDRYDEDVFGYQEHWAEYRYRPNQVSGLINPYAANSLNYWTLADKFTSRPQLDATFITENRDAISRCLVTGANGPDFIADFYFDYTAIREMPTYTVPGLLDHFGSM